MLNNLQQTWKQLLKSEFELKKTEFLHLYDVFSEIGNNLKKKLKTRGDYFNFI